MTILIYTTEVILETEAFALCLLQRNTHDSLRRGGIAGSGILHNIHMLYLVGTQS